MPVRSSFKFNKLAYSVYIQHFEGQRSYLDRLDAASTMIFLSLHLSEEFSAAYCKQARAVCHRLADRGFYTIADVSPKTLKQFGEPDLFRLAGSLRLSALRMDYGFTDEEIASLAERLPVVLNASTALPEFAGTLLAKGLCVFAMHNFYPRPETGLDAAALDSLTTAWQAQKIEVSAFIAGNLEKRGPVFSGLPSLECHREFPPSVAFIDCITRFGLDYVFVGDMMISERERLRIQRFLNEKIIEIPASLTAPYHNLFEQNFTSRPDSPSRLIRFMESREYSCHGTQLTAGNCVARPRGSITMDNAHYARYSGEVQVLREDLPADARVNVIGQVKADYLPLLDCVRNGERFVLVRD